MRPEAYIIYVKSDTPITLRHFSRHGMVQRLIWIGRNRKRHVSLIAFSTEINSIRSLIVILFRSVWEELWGKSCVRIALMRKRPFEMRQDIITGFMWKTRRELNRQANS